MWELPYYMRKILILVKLNILSDVKVLVKDRQNPRKYEILTDNGDRVVT